MLNSAVLYLINEYGIQHHNIYSFRSRDTKLLESLINLPDHYTGLIFRRNVLGLNPNEPFDEILQKIPEHIGSIHLEGYTGELQKYIAHIPEHITELDLNFVWPPNGNYDDFIKDVKAVLLQLPEHIRQFKFGLSIPKDYLPKLHRHLGTLLTCIPPHVDHLSLGEFDLSQLSHAGILANQLSQIPKTVRHLDLGRRYYSNTLKKQTLIDEIPKTVSKLNIHRIISGGTAQIEKINFKDLPDHITSLILSGEEVGFSLLVHDRSIIPTVTHRIYPNFTYMLTHLSKKVIEIDLSNEFDSFSHNTLPHIRWPLKNFLSDLPTHVVKIGLRNYRLGDSYKDCKYVLDELADTVDELDLSSNRFNELSQEELINIFKKFPKNLKKINLSYNGLEKKTKEQWIALLIALPDSVQEITVEDEASKKILREILPQVNKVKLNPDLCEENFPLKNITVLTDLIASYDQDPTFYKKQEGAINRVIKEDLLPLTKEYLKHLSNELSIDFNLEPKLYEQKLAQKEGEGERYKKIVEKSRIVRRLFDCLNDKTKKSILPSQHLSEFTQLFSDENQKSLKEHRNPKWQQYAKNVLVIFAIGLSGIIPGVLALFTYSHFKNKTSPTFFTKAEGKEYVDRVNEVINKPSVK